MSAQLQPGSSHLMVYVDDAQELDLAYAVTQYGLVAAEIKRLEELARGHKARVEELVPRDALGKGVCIAGHRVSLVQGHTTSYDDKLLLAHIDADTLMSCKVSKPKRAYVLITKDKGDGTDGA